MSERREASLVAVWDGPEIDGGATYPDLVRGRRLVHLEEGIVVGRASRVVSLFSLCS